MFPICQKQRFVHLLYLGLIPAVLLCCSWKETAGSLQGLEWINHCINRNFSAARSGRLKKWDLNINSEGFLRLRKYYPNGKEEYFSFNLLRLNTMIYLGTVNAGDIVFKTRGDDVIVQTYNDRKGNIDSMSTSFRLPVDNMEPEELDSLNRFLESYKDAK